MWPPPQLKIQSGQECKLERSLYVFKQALAVWYKTISKVFLDLEFKQCTSDSCIFVRREQKQLVYLALYVDDKLISAKSIDVIKDVSKQLA